MKVSESQVFALLVDETKDYCKEMGFKFDKNKVPNISVKSFLKDYSKAKLNRLIEYIASEAQKQDYLYKGGFITEEQHLTNMAPYQVLIFSIKWYVESRADIGWRISKNWRVY